MFCPQPAILFLTIVGLSLGLGIARGVQRDERRGPAE
jgi:hypothetical protein